MKVDKLTIAVEIEGEPYFVLIPSENKEAAIIMLQGLSKNGKLNVVKAPDGTKFEAIGNNKPPSNS